jgi:hypothetical protein
MTAEIRIKRLRAKIIKEWYSEIGLTIAGAEMSRWTPEQHAEMENQAPELHQAAMNLIGGKQNATSSTPTNKIPTTPETY